MNFNNATRDKVFDGNYTKHPQILNDINLTDEAGRGGRGRLRQPSWDTAPRVGRHYRGPHVRGGGNRAYTI